VSRGFPSWIDGSLHGPGEGRVALDDPAFLGGLGVFETILFAEGTLHFLEQHLERMRTGLEVLSIDLGLPLEEAVPAAFAAYRPTLERVLADRALVECGVRVIATRGAPGAGPSLILGAREATVVPPEGALVVLERRAKLSGDTLEQVKTTARVRNVLAFERARAAGASEALLLDDADEVCEATSANVFALVRGRVLTPSTERGCLAGVTREHVLAILAEEGRPARVERLTLDDLERASELFLTNTTGRLIPVRAVEGLKTSLAGPNGALGRHLRGRLAEAELRYRRTHR
jgi:branched-subunit amino acid aminotransferase/4-amino-4-deoxychorismate lyase